MFARCSGGNVMPSGGLQSDGAIDNLFDQIKDLQERTSILESYPVGADVSITFLVAASNAHSSTIAQADYVCDGTADDVQINAAIVAANAAGGGKVLLSEGTFSLNAYVVAKTKVSIVGMGFGTILQVASGISAHGIYSYNAIDYFIADLAIDVSLSGSGQAGGGSTPCGIYVGHATAHIKSNITIRNCFIKGADEVGIITLGVDHVLILDNIVEDSTFAGIHTDTEDYLVIRGNIIRNSDNYGIRITANTDHSVIAENVVEGCDIQGISIYDSNYNTIVGNIIKDGATANSIGIQIEVGVTSDCDYNTVIGNIVLMQTSVYAGININAGANNTVIGNNSIGSAAYGIREEVSGADYNLIQDNIVSGTGAGIQTLGSNTLVRNNIGYVTENSGTATIDSGTTYEVVPHGLDATPTVINIAFREQADNDYGRWSVTSIGTTNFTVNVQSDPGASNLDFAWEAKVR
jgi:parallel beta-helix repeat protein